MPFPRYPRQKTLKSLVDAAFIQFWLHDSQRPEPFAARHTTIIADLAIIGVGFTGLWTAHLTKEADQSRNVVLFIAG